MEEKMNIKLDIEKIKQKWISCTFSIVPIEIFNTFSKYIYDNKEEIEQLFLKPPHKMCGLIERMWGFYLIGVNLPIVEMPIIHELSEGQTHKHL